MKLFEIPIYAFDKVELQDRIKKWKNRNNFSDVLANSVNKAQKRYEYNHIVGFIEIGIERDDIYGKVYLPCTISTSFRFNKL